MRSKRVGFILPVAVFLAMFFSSVALVSAFTLPDTGQTKCYQSVSPYAEIACAGTGQDGAYNSNPMSYTDNGNGTITDNVTGLMWQKGENATKYNWYQASGTYNTANNSSSQNVCGSLTLGGLSDWRLPTKMELMSIVDYSISSVASINTTYFPNAHSTDYWSSTTYAYDTNSAWDVCFYNGSVFYTSNKSYKYYVRCVRGEGTVPAQNNCAASISSSLVVHVPVLTYSGANYYLDLQYDSTTGQLTVAGAGVVSDVSSYSSCTASTLSSDLKLHVPVVMLNSVSYWLDLQLNGSAFAITGAGQN